MHLPATTGEAIALQKKLAAQVQLEDALPEVKIIAGVDVSYDIKNDISCAVIVQMPPETLVPLATVVAHLPTPFPYVPGLLSFREIPVILKALAQLPLRSDLLMVDGHGIAHPRRLGIAAHLGVLTDMPAIGVAKSRLTGTYEEPALQKGSQSLLWSRKERIGTVLRSKDNVNPLFISPGHRVSHDTAIAWTLRCLTRYRLPEPTRLADKISKQGAGVEGVILASG